MNVQKLKSRRITYSKVISNGRDEMFIGSLEKLSALTTKYPIF